MDPETAPPGAAAAVAPQLGAPPTLTFEERLRRGGYKCTPPFEERLAGMDVAACRAEMEKEDLEAGQTELISQRIEHLEVK